MATSATAVALALASTAFACVTFMGKVEVEGARGTTEVVGTGNSHAYCSEGRPTTAAAGRLSDSIKIKVKPGKCDDAGAAGNHQLPGGTYEVRFNNAQSYTFEGTHYTHIAGSGCFRSANAPTTSKLGEFTVDANGFGTWIGTISGLKQDPVYSTPLSASNICIGAPTLPPVNGIIPGMLAPYQLLLL